MLQRKRIRILFGIIIKGLQIVFFYKYKTNRAQEKLFSQQNKVYNIQPAWWHGICFICVSKSPESLRNLYGLTKG